ncbi:MAG: hypothetical protein QOI58_244 [Thermoanaerobaculia bacterium]|jgi:hypothetical protein|nr:hypothetical protein [Thermoanaerobaculia bacterium]
MRFPLTAATTIRIEDRIRELLSQRPIIDDRANKMASDHATLPLFRGREGFFGISVSGEMLVFRWDHFDQPQPALPRGTAYGALIVGSRKFPELAALLPSREEMDEPCESCAGTGSHPLSRERNDDRILCDCGGLGFTPHLWPNGTVSPPRPKGNTFPDIVPTSIGFTTIIELCPDHHILDTLSLDSLTRTMYEHPEIECHYYSAKNRPNNAVLGRAIDQGVFTTGPEEYFYYEREPGTCAFLRIEPHTLDDRFVEHLFAWEVEYLDWLRNITRTEMFWRSRLQLNDTRRRQLDLLATRDSNPFEAKPGLFGFNVDLLKLPNWISQQWQRWRRRRRKSLEK